MGECTSEARPGVAIHRQGGHRPLGAAGPGRFHVVVERLGSILLRLAIGCAASALPGRAQEPPDPAIDPRAAARAAVEREIEADERENRVREVIALDGGAAALLLADRGVLDPAVRRYTKDAQRYLHRFQKCAGETLRKRRGRGGEQRIDTLRREVLKHSRDPDLEKATVENECDPRLAELDRLFVVHVAEVWEFDSELAAEAQRLRAEAAWLVDLFLIADRAEAVLLGTLNGERFLRAHKLAEDPRGFVEDLERVERELAAAATPIETRDAKVLARNAGLAGELDPQEVAGIAELNRIRMRLGIGALAIDVKLCAAGRDHSKDMVELGFFAHVSPVEGKHSFGDRAAKFGTSANAENIAGGQATGHGAIGAWWYSPGHHRNMMSGAARVGLGRHESHWTQMFGG